MAFPNLFPGTSLAEHMGHLAVLAISPHEEDREKFLTLVTQTGLKVPTKKGATSDVPKALPVSAPATDQKQVGAATPPLLAAAPPAPVPVAKPEPISNLASLSTALGAIQPPAAAAPRVTTPAAPTVQAPRAGPDPASLALIMELLKPQPAPELGSLITGIG
jgi:hypothetical protein